MPLRPSAPPFRSRFLPLLKSGYLLGAMLAVGSAVMLGGAQIGHAQLKKANQILVHRGVQIQGMVTKDDVFHLSTYQNASYTAINWLWDSNPSLMGTFPWSRWVNDETVMPGSATRANEIPYTNTLLSLQLADEWNLSDPTVRTRAVNWFDSVRTNWQNTILYANNFGGQVGDAQLGDFINRAKPDMLCFDLYPYRSDYTTRVPLGGAPTTWYSELRRYRQWAMGSQIPLAVYRQTFHAVQDYDQTVYRDPSPSELRLNTFSALAFNAKWLIDFTFNTGASSLFTTPGGDSNPTGLYTEEADINSRAINFGKALVCLTPVYDLHNTNTISPPPGPGSDDPNFPSSITTSIMILRGKHLSGGVTNFTAVPISFVNDPSTQNPANPAGIGYTWWESDKNDPYLRGWSVTNTVAVKNNGLPGDVIIAWFKPLDENFDGPGYTNQIYMMVVNGLTDPTGTAADCMQQIKLNFVNSFTAVDMLNPTNGEVQTVTLPIVNTRRQLVLDLNGGEASLFKFSNGAPFVGRVSPAAPRLSLDVQTGGASVTLQGTIGARYQIQVTTSLVNLNWKSWTNTLLSASSFTFRTTTSSSANFYRAIGLP